MLEVFLWDKQVLIHDWNKTNGIYLFIFFFLNTRTIPFLFHVRSCESCTHVSERYNEQLFF